MTNCKKKSRPARVMLAALVICMGAFFFPTVAHAQTAEKDTTPPTLAAEVSGDALTVSASDELSGVQGIFVDGRRVATLVNGGATVNLKDYHGNAKEVSVYAVDNAGNKSEPVKFANPHYQAPAQLPAASVPTPPASSSTPAPSTPAPSTPAPSSTSQPATSSSSSAAASSGTQQPGASQPQADSSDSSESAIPGESTTFTPDGTGTVQDNATEEDGKEFFTVTTADGNVYYLVIDRQRGQENVYFLNAVTEADLLALANTGTVPGESAIPTPEPDLEPAPDDGDNTEPIEEDSSTPATGGGMGTIFFIIIAALAVGGAGWYFKIYKPKQQAASGGDDFDDVDDGDDYGLELDDAAPFDLDELDDMDDEAGRDAYEQDGGDEYGPEDDGA